MYCFNNLETSDMSQKIKSTHLRKKIFYFRDLMITAFSRELISCLYSQPVYSSLFFLTNKHFFSEFVILFSTAQYGGGGAKKKSLRTPLFQFLCTPLIVACNLKGGNKQCNTTAYSNSSHFFKKCLVIRLDLINPRDIRLK